MAFKGGRGPLIEPSVSKGSSARRSAVYHGNHELGNPEEDFH